MHKEEKVELAKIQSLMERMDKHYTKSEVNMLMEGIEEVDNRSDAVEVDGQAYKLNSPQELVKLLSKEEFSPQNGWRVTIGYIKKFDKLGNKTISGSVDSFSDDSIASARGINSKRINDIIDNPTYIEKGINKGKISNPFMPNSISNYIVEASITMLMYGRNREYINQKNLVQKDLEDYANSHPDEVKHYIDSYNNDPKNIAKKRKILDFAKQSYDDGRASSETKVANTNVYQKANGSYSIKFNTPKKVFEKRKEVYFLITDENNIEEITKEEAIAYANLYGIESKGPKTNPDAIVQQVTDVINNSKANRHNGDIWTNYDLDSIFLMNFTPEERGYGKLQYFNENAIVEFVKENSLKSGIVPGRKTTPGVFKDYLNKMK